MVALIVLLSLCFVSCTVTPPQVHSQTVAYEGNIQTAGFLGFSEDGSGIITGKARDRYNALVRLYGAYFVPPLVQDDGLSQSWPFWLIEKESLVRFQTMARWLREGKKPVP